MRPADYDLQAEAAGFAKVITLSGVTVDAARETAIQTIKLQPATVSQSIDVSANETTVQTNNAEISDTVTMEEIQKLPLLDRDPARRPADPARRRFPGKFRYRHRWHADVLREYDARRHQYSGQLHPRQRA